MVEMEGSSGWSAEMEVNLLHAMRGHKPVGVNRHFQMLFIHEKLNGTTSTKKLTPNQIWETLGTMYDLQALNESEIIPFPNKELDFSLPDELVDLKQKDFPRMPADQIGKPSEDGKHDHSKAESKVEAKETGSSRSSKPEQRQSTSTPVLQTPDNSPKRKRTRHTPSATASPATPDGPPTKRRR